MSIVHAQSTIGARGESITYIVNLGASQTKASFGTTEAHAGWRLFSGATGPSQVAQSPDNSIVEGDWGQDRIIITPPGFSIQLFQFKWDLFSEDAGFTSLVSPAAEGVFATWNGDEEWIANRVGVSTAIEWIIDITLREIANPANSDAIRVTLRCEVGT